MRWARMCIKLHTCATSERSGSARIQAQEETRDVGGRVVLIVVVVGGGGSSGGGGASSSSLLPATVRRRWWLGRVGGREGGRESCRWRE